MYVFWIQVLFSLLSLDVLASHLPHHARHAQKADLEKRLDLLGPLTGGGDATGDHEFQAPTKGQQRGPCPALNALANHGYIPRNGVVSLLGAATAINQVYGMSIELATLLAVMGVVWTGDPVSLDPSFSIGGPDPEVQNLLGNVLGTLGSPRGIDHSHNFIEADSSPTRDDLYVTGDPVTMNLKNFEMLYDMIPEHGDHGKTLDIMADFAKKRFDHSIATNPYFYYGPVTGLIARNAGFCFLGNLLSDHTEDPKGTLSREIFKSFFSVTGERDNFKYKFGHEKIPENWKKRDVAYGLVELNLDIVHFVLRYPVLASIGGNTGKVNSFTGLDLAHPVKGLTNLGRFLEGNNLMCFALEILTFASPDYLNNIYSTLGPVVDLLSKTVGGSLLSLACPEWKELTKDGVPLWQYLGSEYPGANKSGSAL